MEVQELFSKFSSAAITFVSGQVEVRMLQDGQAVVTFSRGWADLDILTIENMTRLL